MVVLSQPFPSSVKQNAKLEEAISVRLLTGAKNDFRPLCVVKAQIISSNNSSKKSTKNAPLKVENGERTMNEQGISVFKDLKFPNGTRLKSIRLKFSTDLNLPDRLGNIHPISFESAPTGAIVVKTNENQWFESEGILIKKTVFEGGQNEVPWHRFANWLQRRYIMATRQHLQTPMRSLTSHDFKYMHKTKFDNKPMISQSQFDKFWQWFGPLLHKIRHQRFVCPLWTKGLICGFLSREEVEPVLRNEKIGTFLIRFSENQDTFAISYQSGDQLGQTKVKHYLIKSDDTHGAKRTLADFLKDFRDLSCILQLTTEKGTEKRILHRCEKDAALGEFYSKKSSKSADGYEEQVEVVINEM